MITVDPALESVGGSKYGRLSGVSSANSNEQRRGDESESEIEQSSLLNFQLVGTTRDDKVGKISNTKTGTLLIRFLDCSHSTSYRGVTVDYCSYIYCFVFYKYTLCRWKKNTTHKFGTRDKVCISNKNSSLFVAILAPSLNVFAYRGKQDGGRLVGTVYART